MSGGVGIPSVSAVIGANLKRLRTDRGITQDRFAVAARKYGMRWSESKVSSIERGDFMPKVQYLPVMAMTLADLSGKPVTWADLYRVDPRQAIQITDELIVSGTVFTHMIGDLDAVLPMTTTAT